MTRGAGRSPRTIVLIGKVWLPLLGALGLVTIFWGSSTVQWLFTIPFLAMLAFFFTAAEIEVGEKSLRYRRFFRWKQIPYEAVLDASNSWFLLFPYVKLKYFLPPWGKLYYFSPAIPLGVRSGATIGSLIRDRLSGKAVTKSGGSELSEVPRGRTGAHWIFGNLCALTFGTFIGFTSSHAPRLAFTDHYQSIFHIILRIIYLINQPISYCAVTTYLIIRIVQWRLVGLRSLISSFLVGGMVTRIFLNWT